MAAAGAGPDERARLDARASAQHGLCTTADLRWAGITEGAVRRMVRRGELVRVHRGVFRLAGTASSDPQVLLAAILAAGEGAVASHRAAAWLWAGGAARSLTVEVTVANPRQSVRDVVAHRRLLSPLDCSADCAWRHGVPVTSPLVTVVQLGAVVPEWLVARTLDDFVGRKLVTITGVQSDARSSRGSRPPRRRRAATGLGTARARDADPRGRPRTDARRPLRAVRAADAVLPARDHLGRLSSPARLRLPRASHRHRGRWLRVPLPLRASSRMIGCGPTRSSSPVGLVLRFTWHELVHRPDRVAATIRQAVAGRAARGQAA